MTNFKSALLIAVLAAGGLANAGFAQGSPNPPATGAPTSTGLYLYDVGTQDSIFVSSVVSGVDNGYAYYNGHVGNYTVVVSADGFTSAGGIYPVLDLDINSVTINTSSPDTLNVFYSDGLFGPTSGSYSLSTYAGTGSVAFQAYLGSSYYTPSGTQNLLANGILNSASSYYLTIEQSITGSGVPTAISTTSELSVVPEPSTVVGAALMLVPLGVSAVRSWRKSHNA